MNSPQKHFPKQSIIDPIVAVTKRKTLVIGHADCLDGFASMYLVGLALGFDNCDFHPAHYYDTPPDVGDRDLVCVDFSYPPEVALAMKAKMPPEALFLILDHHLSAIVTWAKFMEDERYRDNRTICDYPTVVIDQNYSGVGVVWRYYFPDKEMPFLLKLIQDHDLWKFEYSATKPIVAALVAREVHKDLTFRTFARLIEEGNYFQMPEDNYRELILEGIGIKRYQEQLIKSICDRNYTLVKFCGHLVPMANVPFELRSEAGNYLSKGHPFSVTYDDHHSVGKRKYSLRSQKEGGIDVEIIARRLGGGGHVSAASFSVDLGTSQEPLHPFR